MPARAAAAAAAVALLLAVCAQAAALPRFAEAPEYRNGEGCPAAATAAAGVCDAGLVHISMTLDAHYLRGSMAAVYSLLKHASCPESLFFHFLAEEEEVGGGGDLRRAVAASFPSLRFEIYAFRAEAVAGLISASVRAALESPLNYARNHLADLLPRCVPRAIYLDSDVLAVDDVRRLWETRLPAAAVVAAPEYCHANFSRYFTPAFWSDPGLGRRVFAGRRRPPCYFNTGVMVIDLRRWRVGNYRRRIEVWMELQKEKRIYELGRCPRSCWCSPARWRPSTTAGTSTDWAATTSSAAAALSTRALSASCTGPGRASHGTGSTPASLARSTTLGNHTTSTLQRVIHLQHQHRSHCHHRHCLRRHFLGRQLMSIHNNSFIEVALWSCVW
jgi:hypothetical protein